MVFLDKLKENRRVREENLRQKFTRIPGGTLSGVMIHSANKREDFQTSLLFPGGETELKSRMNIGTMSHLLRNV